jgi:uncharacterized membrane protein YhaH (DUF805 family)
MNFTQAISAGFTNYFNFLGRAARSEFWYWVLFTFLVGLAAEILDRALAPSIAPLSTLWGLATLIPYLAVTVCADFMTSAAAAGGFFWAWCRRSALWC